MVLVLFGVSGAGKTTIGRMLAVRLGWEFADADDFHPMANIEKMAKGIPLAEADRLPWLDTLRGQIEAWLGRGVNGVLACSALKQAYRERLNPGSGVLFVYLKGSFEAIQQRLETRSGHFASPLILPEQITTLEEPGSDEPAITVSADQEPDAVLEEICLLLESLRVIAPEQR